MINLTLSFGQKMVVGIIILGIIFFGGFIYEQFRKAWKEEM